MQVPDPELQKIFGKWEWVSTSGGFAGKAITPAREGYTVRIEFSNEGIYHKFKNDSLADRKQFSFVQKESIQTHQPVWLLSFEGESSLPMAVSFSGRDTLMLDEQVHDGFEYVYARIK